MFPWMRFTVEPLVTHPQEKALLEDKALISENGLAPVQGAAPDQA